MPRSSQIILNSSNYDEETGIVRYVFPQRTEFRAGDEISLTNISIFNSWFNISAAIGNNQVKIDFPSGESAWISITQTIPDGFYDTSAFNYYLQKIMYDNKMYTAGTDGKITYYLRIAVSDTQYGNNLSTWAVTGQPVSGATWTAPTSSRSPRIKFKQTGSLFGFAAETVYGETVETRLDIFSPLVPQINPFNSIIFRCNLVHNVGISSPSDFLYSLGLNASFGSLVSSPQHQPIYNQILQGFPEAIEIRMTDSYNRPLKLYDTNLMMNIVIRRK